ncbi:uncharacterized protein LOC111044029 [Nilaparvata lugens]|uniref:uncharacterized protein LOC111044029 n=1 Tax=Nilaparvata lugens TaxID=108931 RepID=UPI00193E7196|nr:uncharacterized protein LOC111044029 [Nilaparvata lugens]
MALIKVSLAVVSVLILGADSNSLQNFKHWKDNGNSLERLTSSIEDTDHSKLHPIKRRIYDSVGGSVGVGRGGGVPSVPWRGRWFPEAPAAAASPAAQGTASRTSATTSASTSRSHLDTMSQVDAACDDGKTNLTLDWSGSVENYTCFLDIFPPDPETAAFIMRDYIPTQYHAMHECMNKPIHYTSNLPTFGTHRPVWARYGEYKFLPRQRWLHNLEHGAIVMLYHPCAHPLLVRELKDIVKSCLYRHVITPYNLLSPIRPLALVAWGWAMTMSMVDEESVRQFITAHALRGAENITTDGQYDHLLQDAATIVTSEHDSTVCPPQMYF